MNPCTDIVIVAAQRSPIGSFLGSLQQHSAVDLASSVSTDIIENLPITADQIDEVLLGQVYSAGCGPNAARQVALNSGLAQSSRASTINMVCGSGLQSLCLATQSLACQQSQLILAGGAESMSNVPHLLPDMRRGKKMGTSTVLDGLIHDALWDPFHDCHMGMTAEHLAEKYHISRSAQDAYAADSQARCQRALQNAVFDDEITAIQIAQGKGRTALISQDEYPRAGVSVESLSALKPAFKADGTVTAGNASGINDGAAMCLLTHAQTAQDLGLTPLVNIRSFASVGVDPKFMGIGPVYAIREALQKAQLQLSDIDVLEVNEAFAAQVLAVEQVLNWDREKVNVHGGAIALGHPLGASGARICVTLIHEMRRRQAQFGVAALCIGGGMGIAMVLELA